jgi:hypothetical protein
VHSIRFLHPQLPILLGVTHTISLSSVVPFSTPCRRSLHVNIRILLLSSPAQCRRALAAQTTSHYTPLLLTPSTICELPSRARTTPLSERYSISISFDCLKPVLSWQLVQFAHLNVALLVMKYALSSLQLNSQIRSFSAFSLCRLTEIGNLVKDCFWKSHPLCLLMDCPIMDHRSIIDDREKSYDTVSSKSVALSMYLFMEHIPLNWYTIPQIDVQTIKGNC